MAKKRKSLKTFLKYLTNKKVLLFAFVAIVSTLGLLWYINNYAYKSKATGDNITVDLHGPETNPAVDEEFSVKLDAFAYGYEIVAVDIYLKYDKIKLELQGFDDINGQFTDDDGNAVILKDEIINYNQTYNLEHLVLLRVGNNPIMRIDNNLLAFNFKRMTNEDSVVNVLKEPSYQTAIYAIKYDPVADSHTPVEFEVTIGSSVTINPIIPTSTPTLTPTSVPPTSTSTPTPIPPTATNTPTPVPPTATPTITPTPIPPTSTPTPTSVPPTSTPTRTPTPVDTCLYFQYGDANCDENVDVLDYICWRYEYINGAVTPNCGDKGSDFDSLYGVDLFDFTIWRNYFVNGIPIPVR